MTVSFDEYGPSSLETLVGVRRDLIGILRPMMRGELCDPIMMVASVIAKVDERIAASVPPGGDGTQRVISYKD